MSIEDKIKWDKKYANTPKLLEKRNPSQRLVDFLQHTDGTKALDIACGSGRNTLYLAQNGFNVDALDISEVALEILQTEQNKNINPTLVDLEGYVPAQNSYDLIIMTNYLDREIIPRLKDALKKNGVLIIETYMDHPDNEKMNSNPDFLLKDEELKTFFDENYKVLEYSVFDNESHELYRMKKQSIVVQKI